MYIGEIMTADMANGTGMRVSLFVSGCTNCCEGCFNKKTWDFMYGIPWTKELENTLIKELSNPYYEGLTILGGEPFEIENQKELVKLIRRVKKELPEKTIWIYSGFNYERELNSGCRHIPGITDEILDSIDILVDGRFMLQLKDITLKFRGSKNQRIIDMKKTREKGEVVLSELNKE